MATIQWIQFNEFAVAQGLAGVADVVNRPLRQLMTLSGDGPDGTNILGYSKPGHTHDWSDIISGKPTTLAGYGITDGLTEAEGDVRYVLAPGVPQQVAVDHVALNVSSTTLSVVVLPTQVAVDHIVLNATSVTLNPVTQTTIGPQVRQIGFARTQFGGINSTADRQWAYGGPTFRDTYIMNGDIGILTLNPDALISPYGLHQFSEFTQSDSALNAWDNIAATWASQQGKNVEKIFLHAALNQQNQKITIASITPSGLITTGINAINGKQYTTDGVTVGQQFTITGSTNPAFNAVATVTGIPSKATIQINLTDIGPSAGGIMFRPGDGTLTPNNRIVYPGESVNFHVLNPGSQEAKDFQVYRVGLAIPHGAIGLFFDSHQSANMPSASVEYGSTGNQAQYIADISTLFGLYRGAYPGTIYFPNLANYVTAFDTQMAVAAGGCQREGGLNLFSFDHLNASGTNGPFTLDLLSKGVFVDVTTSQTFNAATPVAGVTGLSTAFRNGTGHLFATPDDRAMMSLYAQALLMTDRKFLFFDPANANWAVSPLSARWRAAFEYDIGIPTSTGFNVFTSIPAASGPGGVAVTILGRNFTVDGTATGTPTAIVLARLQEHNSSGIITTYDSTTQYNYPITTAPPTGKRWGVLLQDKTTFGQFNLGDTVPLYHVDSAILVPVNPVGTQWVVSPTGTSGGAGTVASPWDLATACGKTSTVKPGDTVALRGNAGKYGTGAEIFIPILNGTAAQPIVITNFPGEKVEIDCKTFDLQGQYTVVKPQTFCDFEIHRSTPAATLNTNSDGVDLFVMSNGVGDGNSAISLVVHDGAGDGFAPQHETAIGQVIYGNYIYNNGRSPFLSPTFGHGIYAHGTTVSGAVRIIQNNMLTNQAAYGIHCFSSAGNLTNLLVADNSSCMNSMSPGAGYDLLIGGGQPLVNLKCTNNVAVRSDGNTVASIGYITGALNTSGIATGNYFNGLVYVTMWDSGSITFQNNTLVGSGTQMLRMVFNGTVPVYTAFTMTKNIYASSSNAFGLFDSFFNGLDHTFSTLAAWQAASTLDGLSIYTQTVNGTLGTQVFLKPNIYFPNVGNLTIDNPTSAATVAVDISSVVQTGKNWAIYSIYDLPTASNIAASAGTPVLTGTNYPGPGNTVAVPLSGTGKTPPPVPGNNLTPVNALPKIGQFVVVQTN